MKLIDGEFLKGTLRRSIHLFHAVGRKRAEIRADLESTPDEVSRRLLAMLDGLCADIKSKYHRDTLQEVAEFALWVTMKDTAYRDQRDALLRRLCTGSEWFLVNVPDKKPEEWYVNLTCYDEET